MKLLDFFNKESRAPKRQIIFTALISGLANGYLLTIINNAAETVNKSEALQISNFFLFLIDLILLIYTKQYSLKQATVAAEDAINRVRIRVADKLRATELPYIETAGHAKIYASITQDTSLISESAIILINACQQMIVVCICLLYIAYLSIPGFIITVSVLSVSVLMYLYNSKHISAQLHNVANKESEFFNGIKSILVGFKEIKINKKKNDALFTHIETIAKDAKEIKVAAGLNFVIELMFAQTSFYILCASIIFVLPVLSATQIDQVVGITIAILFLFGPLSMVVSAFPMFVRANVAVENIYQLEHEIDQSSKTQQPQLPDAPVFETLEFEQVSFHYPQQSEGTPFGVGPLSFKINKGETLFIVGGNGSGKSTLLKLLAGLYYPLSGDIYINDRLLESDDYAHYRELYSTIFTDFHLFDRLYGIEDVDVRRVEELLKTMGLSKKTNFKNQGFTNTDLSTGQKKRLAYIASVLEDKQIYIFDEWAADQDPEFRQYFYEVLLKDLKAKGKTVIAVSHDDRYFFAADKVIKIEYGRIID
ncbi:cyclic peptide export ABC transporter [Candidatus Methylobacter oryzae]|uniref:Cyclic peptide export ABC transporter n=1 Tax=Candidatus Methylobacter oryzae TaxID=2497749 RepID=A0ABY3C6Z4_9GAMM|nr:cyclic peptide export ABC transporter [Candidatus Methylobacter oryzae]TRW90362.1 cyclic peptide export ABC transporter [Candidatus Methylobacter oryzae]